MITGPWIIVMAGVMEHCYDRGNGALDGKGEVHCEEKAMEHSDDMCHGAL